MPDIGEIVDYDPFSAAPPSSSGGGPQIGDVVDYDPFAPQTNIWGEIEEVGRGIPAGAVQAAGTALRGLAANQPTQRYASYLDEIEHGVRYRTREREGRLPITDDTAYTDILQRIADDPGMFQSQQLWLRHAIEGVRSGNLDALATARSKLPPEAVQERELWKAGEAVSEFAEETFPAKPGYEETLGRAVGEGLGSLGAGLVTAMVPGVGSGLSTAFFTAMGSGEAADRAVAAGATDEQIIEAAGLGAGAGATDILPAEMLLGRIPGANVIANAVKRYGGKRTMQALGRISNQALVESAQEGGQQALQNLIAREVYDPEQQILEGVVENAGIGGIVGGIAGLGREGVYQLSTRRSGSTRGDRARAVREVPPPSPEDEASPIPTADIIEGRERIADAEATENANKYLEVAGLPQIGQPVRIARGRDTIEGVVSDAWEGDDPGLTVRGVDGTETDLSLAQMQAMGASLTGLPMPAPRAEIAQRADEIVQDAQRVQEDLARAEEEAARAAATEEQGGAVEPDRRREIDQIMADVRRDARRRTSEPERPPRPAVDLPRLTRDQSAEVARLITSGMPAAQAVAQVQRGAPSGTAPVDETAAGFGDRPPPSPPTTFGEPVSTPATTASGFGERPPPRPPTSFGEPVVDPGATATGFGDRPAPRTPGSFGQPVISTEGTAEGFGDPARDPRAGTGPRRREPVIGPAGRPDDAGPPTRPTIEGAAEWARSQGPETRAAVEGVAAWARTQGPETRQALDGVAEWAATRGPEGRAALEGIAEWAATAGPQARPTLEGAAEWARTQGPETRSAVEGVVSWARTRGPETRAAIEGVAEWVRSGGPEARQALEGVAQWATTQGPTARPRAERGPEWARTQGPERREPVIGPAGRPEPDTGPPRRPAIVGPQGRRDEAGPPTRPRAGERERWLQQAVAEATGRDFNEARGLAEAVSRATGRDVDRRRALAEAIATAEGGEITESRALAFSIAEATGQDFDQSRALAQWVAEATGGDMDQRRALAEAVEAASGKEFTPRRALAEAVSQATGRDITEARGFAQDVARMTGRDVDMRRALAQAIAEDPGRDVNEDRALAMAVAEATGRDLNEARALAEDVAAATGRDVDRRRALAEAIAESSGQDIDERRALAEAVAAATGAEINQARAIAEDVSRLTGQDMNARRALAQAVEEASGTDITQRRALAEAIATATGQDIDQARGLAQAVAQATGRDVDARRALAQAIAESSGRDIPRARADALAADDRRQTLSFRALERAPTAVEVAEAAEEAGLPPQTAMQVGEQVRDALRGPDDAAPTPDMISREVQATGLPAEFGDRIARLVAERQGMLPEPLERRDTAPPVIPERREFREPEQREVPPGIPEEQRQRVAERGEEARARAAEARASAAAMEGTRAAEAPEGLPEDFAERMTEAVAAMPELRRLPEGTRERLAAAVAERVVPPNIETFAAERPEGLPADFGERLRAVPGIGRIPVSQRAAFERKVAEAASRVAGLPQLGEPPAAEAAPAPGLPEGFDERQEIARAAVEAARGVRLPEGARERLAASVEELIEPPDVDLGDVAVFDARVVERLRDLPEVRTLPPAERERFVDEVRGIPEDVRQRMVEREAAERPAGLPDDFSERIAEKVAAAPEARRLPVGFADRIAERVAAIPDLPGLGTMDLAERIADMPELEGIPDDVRNRMAARTAVETMRIPEDVRQRMAARGPVPRPEAPRIDEREEPERAALPEPLPPPQEREVERPPGLPEGFAERIAERVAEIPEVQRLPESARARLDARLEEAVEQPDIQLGDPAAFDERVRATLEERVRAIPEVRTLPPDARDRVVSEVVRIPEGFEARQEADRDAQAERLAAVPEIPDRAPADESAALPPVSSTEVERAEGETELGRGAPPPPIMRKDGSPFKTRQGAVLAARNKKIEAEPVEVEGGWALQQAAGAMPAEPASLPPASTVEAESDAAPVVPTSPAAPPAVAAAIAETPVPRVVRQDAPQPPRAPVGAVELGDGMYSFDPSGLTTDAHAFQYKSGGDAAGVTERLQGIKTWDPLKAGQVIVYERRDGTMVVADGHQRLGLANRMAALGQTPKLFGALRREVDGWTEPEVRAMAALKNIAEGSGDAFDAATVLRDAPKAALDSLPPQSNLVRTAKDIARLDDGPFRSAKAAGLPAGTVGVVGRVAEGDGPLQQALIEEFADRPPPNVAQAEAMARMFRQDRTENEQVADLFGETEVARSLYRERARIIDGAIRRLKQDKRVFATLSRNAEQIQDAGNVLAADNEAIADAAGRGVFLVQQLATRTGDVSDAVKAAASDVDAGRASRTQAIDTVVEAVRKWVAEGGSLGRALGGARESDEGRRQTPEEGDPDEVVVLEGQEAMFQRTPGPPLRATHSIDAERLVSALQRGTLIAPSIAIQPAEVSHRWKTESVDLVFKAGAIDPKRDKIAAGDDWTPVTPETRLRVKKWDDRRAAEDRWRQATDEDAPPLLDEKGLVEDTILRETASRLGRTPGELVQEVVPDAEPVFRDGYDRNGNARFSHATPQRIIARMRRDTRENEKIGRHSATLWNTAELVARNRKPMRSTKAVREAAAQRIMNRPADEALGDLDQITTRVVRMATDTGVSPSALLTAVNDAKLNARTAAREISDYSQHGPVPVEEVQGLVDAVRAAIDSPVRYFETKPLREIPLSDVAAAVVPPGFPAEQREALEAQGIEVREKREDMSDEELAEVQSIPSALFKRAARGTPAEQEVDEIAAALQAQQDRAGGAGQAAPPPRVRIRLNRRYDEAREGVRGDLERIGRETFGNQFRFELAESITAPEGGTVPGAFDPANRIAYIALRADEAGMTGSLFHEGLHYLRNAGAFDKADGTPNAAWQTLERQAAQWRQDYGIDERYAGDVGALDPAARERLLNEEAIAEALADYATKGRETGFGPTVRMALNRILRFFRAMREGLRGRGFQTWEDVFEADIGRGRAGQRADAAQAPSRAEFDRQLQTAWHGSPHRFDEFSTAAIGTGEGAQVYGWGLYFADKEGVADWYREGLANQEVRIRGELVSHYEAPSDWTWAQNLPEGMEWQRKYRDFTAMLSTGQTVKEAREYIAQGLASTRRRLDRERERIRDGQRAYAPTGATPDAETFELQGNVLSSLDAELRALTQFEHEVDGLTDAEVERSEGGAKYKVDLAPKDRDYLYWDRPLYLQPRKARKAADAVWARLHPGEKPFQENSGGEFYEMIAGEHGSQRAASEALLAEGVRGIKYLDQSSRPMVGLAGRARMPLRETFNYVIFDDSDVAIQEIMLQRRRAGQGDLALGDDPRQTELPGTERLSERGVEAAKARDREQSQELLEDVFGEDAVRRSDRMRSDKPQQGVEDLALFSRQQPLFQRGAKEDPKAFDKSATDWSGVDLTGAAEEVVKDKDRMGGFAESVKAGLKGTTAIQDPSVTVQEEKTHKDLNLAWRYLAPNLAWSKKYPAVHAVIKQGVETEKNMSNWIQRLNDDLDQLEKPLSKDEFAQLTGIMFLGDAEQMTFSDEQLGRFDTTDKVRTAYRESRKLLDKIGRFTEQHERAMALPLLTRRTTLVRQMAGERGMDKAEFRNLYNTRAELLGKQRRGEGDPRVLEFEIADATETVFGGKEAPSELFLDRLKEADRLETRIADTKVRRREGYVPHKFFGRWRIFQAAQPDDEIEPYMGRGGTGFKDRKAAEKVAEASEGGILEGATPVQVDGKWGLEPKWKEVAGEHGLWKTRSDAVRAASHMARESPSAEIRVVPVEFDFPHDSATTLGDTAYFTFRSKVEELTGLSGEALQEFVTGVARRPFRRRIAGFLQYRTGMTGYSLDLDRVLRTHIGEAVRYISLDKLKFDAINMMEKEGLSAYRSSIQDRPVLAAAVQAWFRDVNGQKQQLESQIDDVLNKPWVTPIRGGLAAGALAFAASSVGGINPVSPIMGAYVGYRVGRGLAQGGDFKTRSITGSMLGDMAHLKLGAFFNLMSALVNTTQVVLNTYPVLGERDTAVGIKRYNKAILSKLRGKPNADWRFLKRMDIHPIDTFAEGTRHKFQKESKLSKLSMVFFTTAEGFNRGVTALGALNKAQRKGWSHKRAKDFANETLDRTQFHYGASDKPELLRNTLLRVPLQFKNFVAHQVAFVAGLRGAEIPRFLLAMALTAGALGIPGLDFVDTLTDWLFDFSPIAMMKEAALDAAVEGELEGGIATFLTRGVPGLAGVDMTGRVGMGDKFLPLQFRDWTGPWASTVKNAVRHGSEGAHWTHQVRNLSPGLGNPLVVLDAWENGGQVRSPWKRNRPEYVATETELIQKLAGARPIREARLQDLRDIERRDIERYRTDTRRYVDRIVAALNRGDRAAARAVMQEALDAGIPISSGTIRRGIQDYGTQRALREFDRLPRTMKPEGMGRRQAIERMAQ